MISHSTPKNQTKNDYSGLNCASTFSVSTGLVVFKTEDGCASTR